MTAASRAGPAAIRRSRPHHHTGFCPATRATPAGRGCEGWSPRGAASFARNFALGMTVEKWISDRLDLVQLSRVVSQDLPLLRVVEVAPLADLVDGPRPRVVPVGEVGGVDDLVLADELHRLGQQPLVGLAGEEIGRAHV